MIEALKWLALGVGFFILIDLFLSLLPPRQHEDDDE